MKRIALLLVGFLLIPTLLFAAGWDSGSTFSTGLLNIGNTGGGATDMETGSAAIPLSYAVVKKTMGGASDQAGTLADGIRGQVIKIILVAKNSSGNYVLTPTTKVGFATITFDTAGDQATLLFVDNTNGWMILGETGTTVAQ
uniref:Uncharacterized protein n=1 Tax=viral metagenome TaxID=1070528 RepID=A0A6H1ZMJ4_9ZZZZ